MVSHATPHTQSKYLVCVDTSEVARKALRFACIKARKRGILLDILHVITPCDIQALQGVADMMRLEAREAAESLLKTMADEASQITGTVPTLLIREGNPGEQILAQTLEDYYTNMVVLGVSPGSNSRMRVINWLTSQSGKKLSIPIMLVPGNLTDEQMEELA